MKLSDTLTAALIGVSIALVQTQVAVALTSAEVAKIAKSITVRIESPNGSQGSGIIIKRQENTYYVLTANHVVSEPGQYQIITPDGDSYPLDANTKKSKSGTDLAVVEFNSSKTYSIAKIGNSDESTEGTVVYVAGFPRSTSVVTSSKLYRFLEGKITANASQPLDEGYSLVYSNSTLPGMSGGPVLNDRGEVIAVHGRAETTAQGSGENVKAVSTGNNLGISVNTFLRLALLDTGVSAPTQTIASAPKADDFYLQGVDKYDKKDYQGAIAQFSRAIEVNPKYADAYIDRGVVYAELKQYDQALVDFNRALDLNPQLALAYNNRGLVYTELKQYDKALVDFNRALDLDAQLALAYNNRGTVYAELKQYEKTLADFNRALDLDAQLALAYNNRGNVYTELKQYDKALVDYTRALDLNPQNALAYIGRGNVYADLKQYDKALVDYNRALDFNPQSALAYNNRGNVYKELKQYEKALVDYTRALDLNPQNALAYIGRGNVYYELKKVDAAINDWRKAISFYDRWAVPELAIAVALYDRGDVREGLRLGVEAIKSNSKLTDLQFLKNNWGWGDLLLKNTEKFFKEPQIRALLN